MRSAPGAKGLALAAEGEPLRYVRAATGEFRIHSIAGGVCSDRISGVRTGTLAAALAASADHSARGKFTAVGPAGKSGWRGDAW